MDGENVTIAISQTPSIISSERHSRTLDEVPRICPLCQSEVRLFFINFNEKLLMCENIECDYPFGYEELQFVKGDNVVPADEQSITSKTKFSRGSPTATCSTISTNAWSEIEKLNQAVEELPSELTIAISKIDSESQKRKLNEEEIQKHIKDIQELNNELAKTMGDCKDVTLKNEKWIRNLKTIQEMSGVQLLKPAEMELLKKEEPVLGLGELKIDIEKGHDNAMSTIKIEILNKNGNVRDKDNEPSINNKPSIN